MEAALASQRTYNGVLVYLTNCVIRSRRRAEVCRLPIADHFACGMGFKKKNASNLEPYQFLLSTKPLDRISSELSARSIGLTEPFPRALQRTITPSCLSRFIWRAALQAARFATIRESLGVIRWQK
jgi:hypothetical protein